MWYYGNYDLKYIAILDDGHGIKADGMAATPGKRSPCGILENEFNHAAMMFTAEALKRCGIGVYLVSEERSDTALSVRVSRANAICKTVKDKLRMLFCSIHYNAYNGIFDNKKGGIEIYHFTGSVNGKKAAQAIYSFMVNGTPQYSRGVKEANFYVLKYTTMAAILSENGFMDKKAEALLMRNVDFQRETGEEHAQGICKYFGVKYIPPVVKPVSGKLYRVQVGAFANKENAVSLVKALNDKGFDGIIV